jgi:hypothetical protein
MPNWCNNGITLRHADPAMIDRVIKGKDGLLMEFLPTPQELIDTVSGFVSEAEQAAHNLQQESNRKKYGHADWYQWNIANWGTKWDFGLENVERHDPNTVSAAFDSAWAPPTGAYARLMDLGFEVEAFYYEPGMAFVGKWVDGVDDCYEYGAATADTVRDMIGEELDDYFGISEQMADWEAENAEEDQE